MNTRAAALLLFAATVVAYRPAIDCDFVNLDDPAYVQGNPILHGGLSWESAGRAFTTVHAGYWIPLTWLSYLVDFEIGGLDPASYHRTNVLLHAATAALLLLALARLTGAPAPSMLTAVLFAFHPVQVESVAWVTERKDVLSMFFAALTLLAYARYAESPSFGRYVPVFLCLALGLMAKPMLVTMPVLLLLLDFWPLRRGRRILEKLPLFALALAAGLLAIWTQKQGDAVRSAGEFSPEARLGNALFSAVEYLRMLLWPDALAVFYPHPGSDLSFVLVLLSAGVLLAVTVVVWRLRDSSPWLLVGWLWYLTALAPVSGILQAGWQGRADRFLYLPCIGLFFMASMAICNILGNRRALLALPAGVALVACVVLTRQQLRHWRDSLSLWEHALATADDSFTLRDSLAAALLDRGRFAEAESHLRRARELKPDHELAHCLSGQAALGMGELDVAAGHFEEALRLSPRYQEAQAGLIQVRLKEGRDAEAERMARELAEREPRSALAWRTLAQVQEGDAALRCLRVSTWLDPHDAATLQALGDRAALRKLYPRLRE